MAVVAILAAALTDDPPGATEGLLRVREELRAGPSATVPKTSGKSVNFRVSWRLDADVALILTPGRGRVAVDGATNSTAKSKTVVIRQGREDEVVFGQPPGPPLSIQTQAAVNGADFPAMLVAIQPSTGDILAVAQSAPNQQTEPNALSGMYEPGSTFKVATAAAVLERNAASSDSVLPCPVLPK